MGRVASLPSRVVFKERLMQLFDYERFTIPVKKGGRYFYLRNSGVQNQRVLYVRDTVDGAGRVLIDPNTWAKDGANALAEWAVSSDGKHVAYAVQDGGADGRTIKVLNVNTAAVLPDEIKWAKYTSIVWAKGAARDPAGFFYTRFPELKADTDDRVVPAHTFKYVAALQAAEVGPKPHMARIETRAGHGAGKPTDKVIEEAADMWALGYRLRKLKISRCNLGGNGRKRRAEFERGHPSDQCIATRFNTRPAQPLDIKHCHEDRDVRDAESAA